MSRTKTKEANPNKMLMEVTVRDLQTGEGVLQNTMEFVKLKDNGDERGVRVVEGWTLGPHVQCWSPYFGDNLIDLSEYPL